MLIFIKVGDIAKLENFDNPALDGHYRLNQFIASPDREMKIEWGHLETSNKVEMPLVDFEEHVKYLIPCTPIRFVKIKP